MASSNSMPCLPAGFRFHPTDEELIVHYLMNQAASIPCPVPIIAEVNIYQCNPWDLPPKALFGEKEWYFFSPRERKYPNGARPNRAAGSGYWKATGTDKAILSAPTGENVGVKKALVFYRGKPPRGVKTDWIMHEYRLTSYTTATKRSRGSSSMRLDDWVLCRIYKKSNDFQSFSDREGSSTVEEADSSFLNNNNSSVKNGGETETSPRYEKASNDDDHHPHPSMMIKSCSLTDLLNNIDYSALSQLLLDAPPAEPDEEPQQQQRCRHPLNYTVNDQPRVDALCPDYGASCYNNGLKRKRIMTVVDDGASSFFDDGSRSKEKLQLQPGDSRSGGGGFFGTTSGYCNQQLPEAASSSFLQYNSHPFLNRELMQ